MAHQVVMGEVEWSPTQARVFGQLLAKCLPDLSAGFVLDERAEGNLAVLSRADLEALAAGAAANTPNADERGQRHMEGERAWEESLQSWMEDGAPEIGPALVPRL